MLATAALLLGSSLPAQVPATLPALAQDEARGRVLGTARGQVAWLDLFAPRPTPLTQLLRPAYAADVAAAPDVPFGVASIVGAFSGTDAAMGGDLMLIDLSSGASRMIESRQSDSESLDLPAIWPDGSGILYQRSNLRAVVPLPGQAQPQYQSRVEQLDADGRNPRQLLVDARYPGPSPDATHFVFVRSSSAGAGMYVHSLADGSDSELVPPGQFLALAYPRYSPDGRQVAFVAIALLSPAGDRARGFLAGWFEPRAALAHGFPWEVWIVNADGSGMRQIPDLIDDDPSVAWSSDGSQLLVYGGWGSFLVDVASAAATPLPYLAGYGSVAWLPD